MTVNQSLVDAVRRELAIAADPSRAEGMQRYLKSELPCYGIRTPTLVSIWRDVFGSYLIPDRAAWQATILELWDHAVYREERYAAMGLAGHRLYRAYQDPGVLPLYKHLVVSGAWWDLVDSLATKRIGPLVRAYPVELMPAMREWAQGDDMWLRRVAIIHQIGANTSTDAKLLNDCIAPSLGRSEFFLRKSIGWALREYAKSNPDWVGAYVDRHHDLLSPLSRREATKHLH